MSLAMLAAVIMIIAGVVLVGAGYFLITSNSGRTLLMPLFGAQIREYTEHPVRYPLVAIVTGGLMITIYFGAVPVPGAVVYPGYLLAFLTLICLFAGLTGGFMLGLAAVVLLLAMFHASLGNFFLTETSAVFALLILGSALFCRFIYILRTPRNAG